MVVRPCTLTAPVLRATSHDSHFRTPALSPFGYLRRYRQALLVSIVLLALRMRKAPSKRGRASAAGRRRGPSTGIHILTETSPATEDDEFLAICRFEREPDPEACQAGRDAWDAGTGFHEGPQPFESVKALSWRIGWNERALASTARRGR